jgi:hypothetical protein
LGDEAVADPGFRLEVEVATVAEFFAEVADGDAEVLGLGGGVGAPDGVEQLAVAEDLAGTVGHVEEQVELLGGEVDVGAADGDAVVGDVDGEVADVDGLGGGGIEGSLAAELGADAGLELLDVEGLGDVVVGAGVEGGDLGSLLLADGEDEDGSGGDGADLAAELDAAHLGHGEVGDDEVGLPLAEEDEAVKTVGGGADVVALGAEDGLEGAEDLRLVVDEEEPGLVGSVVRGVGVGAFDGGAPGCA